MIAYMNEYVALTTAGGRHTVTGRLVDQSADLVVLYDGTRFIYVPLVHIAQLTRCPPPIRSAEEIPEPPLQPATELSYRKVLLNAKGVFSELYVAGNRTIHGYVTSVMNDFFVFNSPVYRSLYVAMRHLKMLAPFAPLRLPYALERIKLPARPAASLARTFDQQLGKLENEFVILNLGEYPRQIGLLKTVDNHLLELVAADGTSSYMHLDHVRTIHLP
ncbi:DUF2642 domain-containing protein [Cohnella cellulosilytica]|uniref:DUF2642 domain-containing protein n=1 Tax=Cohnella cellulosilytica TaxID=986710 RepID=A0ABW2F722_9BACL